MAESKLGKLAAVDEQRDAMHVAVIPAMLAVDLPPGCPVSIINGWAYPSGEHIGIIDPFLEAPLKKGNRVWVIMYPNTVVNLRHDWTHSAVPSDKVIRDYDDNNDDSDECRYC